MGSQELPELPTWATDRQSEVDLETSRICLSLLLQQPQDLKGSLSLDYAKFVDIDEQLKGKLLRNRTAYKCSCSNKTIKGLLHELKSVRPHWVMPDQTDEDIVSCISDKCKAEIFLDP